MPVKLSYDPGEQAFKTGWGPVDMRLKQAGWWLGIALLFLLFGAPVSASEQPVMHLNSEALQKELDLSSYLQFVEDDSREWGLQQAIVMLQEHGQGWNRPGFPIFGFTTRPHWASLTLSNDFEVDQHWYLRLRFPTLDRIDFFFQGEDGQWQQKTTGDTFPFDSRDARHHHLMLGFPVLAGQTQTLYFRLQTEGSLQVPLSVLSQDYYRSASQAELLSFGLYFGMIVIIAFYSGFMWLFTRDRTYLMFSLFILAGGMYSFAFHGLAFQYFWPGSPGWANLSVPFFVGLAAASGMQFARLFINIPQLGRNLDLLVRVLIGISLLYAALALVLNYVLLSRSMMVLVLVLLGTLSWSAWVGMHRGERAASYFMVAWTVLVVSVLAEVLQRAGLNVPPFLSYHGIQFGTVVAILVLSLGLSDRVTQLIEQYKNVQSEILRANQQKIDALQKADNLKEEFIANVSHELRTPLTGIIGLSEIMLEKRGALMSDSDRDTLTMIKVSGQRLASLVNDVIDFSAIKNGRLELHSSTVDLKAICSLVARMSRPLIGTKPLELIENYPGTPVMVNGDEDRLQQVLFNLVSNAIKFTYHGSVTIRIDIIDIDARVSVQDTGIGISEEDQKKIFNRFYQVDSAETRQEGGTGLGLAISQKLVELHGTEIILRSAAGEGSTFYFDLPVVKTGIRQKSEERQKPVAEAPLEMEEKRSRIMQMTAPIQQRRRSADVTGAQDARMRIVSGKGRRILVVDDEYLNLRIVQEHLSDDYELLTALSGHEALGIMESIRPDLIILDLMMPVMTGFELCERIRMKYRLDELPVVILTAKNRVEDLVKGLSVGANDYITKPFSKEELKVRISKQFELLQMMEMKGENQRLMWQLEKYQQNERQLREREGRLAKMLDVTGEAMLCVDESGLIVYVNRKAETLFGISDEKLRDKSLKNFQPYAEKLSSALADAIAFPFQESAISDPEALSYSEFSTHPDKEGNGERILMCILPLSLDQELYLLLFRSADARMDIDTSEIGSLPQIIRELNRNEERTQQLRAYLSQITPEALQNHRHLFEDLENMDRIIQHMSEALPETADEDLQYREALVKLMQDCHYYWQKVTGQSIIELAEKSRIWSVSIDNGRLRTRSMNRYLSLDKLPENPRWRQVARTAYFVLSKVSHDEEAKQALEKSVARLQDIVEAKALT